MIEQNLLEKIAYSIYLNDRNSVTNYAKQYFKYTNSIPKPNPEILVKIDRMLLDYGSIK